MALLGEEAAEVDYVQAVVEVFSVGLKVGDASFSVL